MRKSLHAGAVVSPPPRRWQDVLVNVSQDVLRGHGFVVAEVGDVTELGVVILLVLGSERDPGYTCNERERVRARIGVGALVTGAICKYISVCACVCVFVYACVCVFLPVQIGSLSVAKAGRSPLKRLATMLVRVSYLAENLRGYGRLR